MNGFKYSRLAVGQVTHRRHHPKPHWFDYRLYFTWLNLNELSLLNQIPFWSGTKRNLVEFRRSDHLRPLDQSLPDAVVHHLQKASIHEKPSRVMLLTHLRQWGASFNPVSFYVCYRDDNSCFAILSEITNTPWGERHVYVHNMEQASDNHSNPSFKFNKAFHISPFMPMDIQYHWKFGFDDNRITIFMQLYRQERLEFDVSLNLKLMPITQQEAMKMPIRFAFMPIKVVIGIYWQALKLWLKRTPFYEHPRNNPHVLKSSKSEDRNGH